jgi:isoleucyl-tRNA synthetase
MDLRSTLNLPDASATIPMKANLPTLEIAIQQIWASQNIYHKIQDARKDAPVFVLHDGPPYTNSPIHIGTALNKILKDFVLKSRSMMGFRTPYVPGFDNHGLPIEQTVAKKFAEKKVTPSVIELRRACREHAREFIGVQSTQFQRLGVFGLWEKPYATMDYRFEAEIIRTFKRMVEGEHVYKGLRPTLWSPTSRTALADTEIVYHDHVSKAIYVAFPVLSDPSELLIEYPGVRTVIWTTTPWTIPANLACAFHPEEEYAVVRSEGDLFLIADKLYERVLTQIGRDAAEATVLAKFVGSQIEGIQFAHPIFGRPSWAVLADYVTMEDGTGVVHTAPSHGRDDFFTGQKYGLPVPNTVDERGVLTAEAGEFAGVFYKNCDTVVVDRLREVGALLQVSDFHHSYPYAERDDQPVIFRATEQWFVSLDPLRSQMLTEIAGDVRWFPANGYNRIEAMVRNRPDWCVSRQRPWGVGIPVFYGKDSRVPVLDPVAIESVARLVEQEGSDAWFDKDASEILPAGYVHPETGETEFSKETDVLDVWFDSGSTSLCVLEGNTYPEWKEHWPADVYLEGSDQHRGWFNSSLIIATATRGHAPYKAVVTHGFVTDEKGQKMSKRLGNVIDPVKVCEQHGADILRVWAALVKWQDDVPCGDNILKQFGEIYRNLRNVLRFLIGAAAKHEIDEFEPLDQYILAKAANLAGVVDRAYAEYEFGTAIHAIHDFCREELSPFYLDVIKDRLYCDEASSSRRRSSERACLEIAEILIKLLAPIVPHTAEECWAKLGHSETVFLETYFVQPVEGEFPAFEHLLAVRESLNRAFEPWKGTDDVKDTQDSTVRISLTGDRLAALRSFDPGDLATYLKVSAVELVEGDDAPVFARSPYAKCDRSRLRRPDVEPVEIDGETFHLSARDRRVLGVG